MNPGNLMVARSPALNGETLQRLVHWLRRNGNEHPTSEHKLRQQMADRYPAGLLTDDELDALLRAVCH